MSARQLEQVKEVPEGQAVPKETVYTVEDAKMLIEQWRQNYNEVLVQRVEEMERQAARNSQILRAVTMVSTTAALGAIVISGVIGGGKGSHWTGPAWNTMWLYGLFAANAVSLFWTTHKE
jgi:hypothetical protein